MEKPETWREIGRRDCLEGKPYRKFPAIASDIARSEYWFGYHEAKKQEQEQDASDEPLWSDDSQFGVGS